MDQTFGKIIPSVILSLILSACSGPTKVSTNDSYEVVEFPDGSVAYLNKNSSVSYDPEFNERIVEQSGEVFFEVTKSDAPFIVKTVVGEVKVLGTEFDVKADDAQLTVEVESGSVEIQANKLLKKISKGQKALFKEIDNDIQVTRAELAHEKWLRNLEKEFAKMGRKVARDSKKAGKDSKKEFRKLKKKLD
jgi:transmembrane sensor